MKFSEKTDQLFPALKAAQNSVEPPVKDKTAEVAMKSGGKYSFSYADLDMVMTAIKGPMEENKLMMIQGAGHDTTGSHYGLVTRLVHLPSGQWLETFSELDRKCTAQEQGAEQTFFRRYEVNNIFNVVPVERGKSAKLPAVGNVKQHAPNRAAVIAPTGQADNSRGSFNDFPPGPVNGRGSR